MPISLPTSYISELIITLKRSTDRDNYAIRSYDLSTTAETKGHELGFTITTARAVDSPFMRPLKQACLYFFLLVN